MSKVKSWKLALGVFVACAASAIGATAQTFSSLVYFNEANGSDPLFGSMVQGPDGNFYGVTLAGGDMACSAPYGCGTVFRVTPAGLLTTLHIFEMTDGWGPSALTLGRDGIFYGTTELGGSNSYGTAFKITTKGSFSTLHNFLFTDGYYPRGVLIQSPNGSFYGTTLEGGDSTCESPYGCGTVFRMSPDGAITTLHTFEYSDGIFPEASVILGSDGNFYGTTSYGGANDAGGSIFKMSPNGTLTILHYFCSVANCVDGYAPYAPMIQANNGIFYGTTTRSATNRTCGEGCGTVFQVNLKGKFGTVHIFKKLDGWDANGLIQGTDGNLYGTTAMGGDVTCYDGCGTIFKMTTDGTVTTLYEFNLSGGLIPSTPLLQATDGTFFGTTSGGGVPLCFNGCGTVFSLSVGLVPFVTLVGNPARVGQAFGILGQGIRGTTNVSVNGTSATFTVKSDTALSAVVPDGATTGFVTVVTSSGTLTSNQKFRVVP